MVELDPDEEFRSGAVENHPLRLERNKSDLGRPGQRSFLKLVHRLHQFPWVPASYASLRDPLICHVVVNQTSSQIYLKIQTIEPS